MADTLDSQLGVVTRDRDLLRIEEALLSAGEIFRTSRMDFLAPTRDPARVAALEQGVDRHLRDFLPEKGEGWLSEESTDDLVRLRARRVWIVDPLDGTREFTTGIPEWSISIGLIEDGLPVAGGVHNPATGEIFLGTTESGVTLNGKPLRVQECQRINQATVLASRSEASRGEWDHFNNAPFQVVPMGSVAYKLARVAAGMADATWTLVPKHEWDVAAGVALLCASGGMIRTLDHKFPYFNRPEPLFQGLLAFGKSCQRLFETKAYMCPEWPQIGGWEPGIPGRFIAER